MSKKKVVVIGAGFAGMSTACFMAKAGWDVTVVEKHNQPGGRARKLEENGFVFDMGPSWYWMPDVFDRFFEQFHKKRSDYYTLERLDPSYTVYWPDTEMPIPANYDALKALFETLEPGSGAQLDTFIKEAAYKYEVGIQKLVHKPGQSVFEFIDPALIAGVFKLDVFRSISKHVGKLFKHPHLKQLLEFPVLFLGALPQNTPALYSLMNYADIVGGTWYPKGGMYQIVASMHRLAVELGVQFHFNQSVTQLGLVHSKIKTVVTTPTHNDGISKPLVFSADVVIASADYHHIETKLLPQNLQSYTPDYWNSRVMAPSALLYYVGLNKKLTGIQHHSLFFDTSFAVHGEEIYTTQKWPSNPLFYVSATSVTDPTAAPEGCENLFLLIPVAAGLQNDTEELREKYFQNIITRLENRLQQSILPHIVYKKTYAHSDFINDYHAFKGNAYGLANTLLQTAILKPSCKSKKVPNLFYTGQLTVPGPGVPPSLISGEVVSAQVVKQFGN
jgi:phytoene desaturase